MFGGQSVTSLIEQWQPEKWYRSERKFEEDLTEFLRDNLRDTKVVSQGRGQIDIRVGDDIGIEMKRKLDSKSEVHRLTGQIGDYDYSDVIVVVCGYEQKYIEHVEDTIRKEYRDNPMKKNVHLITKDKDGGGRGGGGGDPFGLGGGSNSGGGDELGLGTDDLF